jgi:hypothetical protein
MRQIRKAKPIAQDQIEALRSVGVPEEEIGRRFKEIGLSEKQRAELGLPIPKEKPVPVEEQEPEIDFLKDISSFLEYAHRELSQVASKFPDPVKNMMVWHRKINRRVDALKAKAKP